MWTFSRVVILLSVGLLMAPPVNSDELLTMRVSAYVPGSLTIQLTIDGDADNRALDVSVEASDYYRSSQIQLDGERAPRIRVLELRRLPTDMYEVTGVLVGSKGPRAKVIRIARVLPD